MGSRYFQDVLQNFIRQRRALLVLVYIHNHNRKSLFAYVGTAENTQRFLRKLDMVFVFITVQTSVEVRQAAFSVFSLAHRQNLQFDNLQLQLYGYFIWNYRKWVFN